MYVFRLLVLKATIINVLLIASFSFLNFCPATTQAKRIENSEIAIKAVEQFESQYQGFRLSFFWEKGIYDRPTPLLIRRIEGSFAWDQKDQKLVESTDTGFGQDGPAWWEKGSQFRSDSFQVMSGQSDDSTDKVGAGAYVKGPGPNNETWWLGLPPLMITPNDHDNPNKFLSPLLRAAHFVGAKSENGITIYKFDDSRRGIYSVLIDDQSPTRLHGLKIEKTKGQHTYRENKQLYEAFKINGLTIFVENMVYDNDRDVCIGWVQREVFQLNSGGTAEHETRFRVKQISPQKPMDPHNVRFELLPIAEGTLVSAQDDSGIEYRWMNNQIVKVVDKNTLEQLDGLAFQPRRSTVWWVMGSLLIAALGMAILIRYKRTPRE